MVDTPSHLMLDTAGVAVLIAVAGAAPGIGKSTLCTALAGWLSGLGLRVDHFREDEVLTREEFSSVAAEFEARGAVQLPTLLNGVAAFVLSIQAGGDDVVIADSLVPFIPSLLAWGHSEDAMTRFLHDLTCLLKPVAPIVVSSTATHSPLCPGPPTARGRAGWAGSSTSSPAIR